MRGAARGGCTLALSRLPGSRVLVLLAVIPVVDRSGPCRLTDTPPAPDPEWTVVAGLPLECPTGELRLGDATGNAVSAEIDTGPGMYVVDVYYRGRSIAQEQRRELLDRTSLANPISIEDTVQFAGIEAYHLHLKPVTY